MYIVGTLDCATSEYAVADSIVTNSNKHDISLQREVVDRI